MAIVISKDKMQKYNVGAYHFKVLSNGENDTHEEVEHEFVESNHINNASPVKEKPKVTQVDSSAISQNSKDALIESLMKNNDEMSSNFIKLQMKLESKEEEYKAEVEKVKAGTFNEGVAAGKLEAQKEFEVQMADRFTQFSNSVATLNESANEFNGALEAIKNSLMNAAIDIATEVINVELSENSSEIAKVLSQELIKELQNASEVTLKVNPTDLEDISNSIASLEHIKVKSDLAVSAGGVIAISDAGNIDAQISKRFERVKKAALSE